MSTSPKVLFLGIDGADPDLLLQWSDAGLMPNLKSLRGKSTWARTTNFLGLGSDAMWTGLFTGVNPGKHGRYFYRQIRRGTYRTTRYRHKHDKHEPFWQALSRAGQRVAVIDVPYAPLCKNLNGIQTADWLAHSPDYPHFTTWPPSLAGEITARFGADLLSTRDRHGRDQEKFQAFREGLLQRVKRKTAFVRHSLHEERWDLFMAVFQEAHDAGHTFWHLHDPTHPLHDPELLQSLGDPVRDTYAAIDTAIGRVLNEIDPRTTVMVYVGTGMGPNYTGNHLLDDILRARESVPMSMTGSFAETSTTIWRRMPAQLRYELKNAADNARDFLLARERCSRPCFAVPHNEIAGAIRINVIGREPKGQISSGAEYENYCAGLERDLLEITNLETGRPIVKEIVRTAKRYDGNCLDRLPDLFVIWRREAPIRSVGSAKIGKLTRAYPGTRTGDHTPNCLLFVSQADLPVGNIRESFSVTDIAPTIVAQLHQPALNLEGCAIKAMVPV